MPYSAFVSLNNNNKGVFFMKTILILLSLSLGYFATADQSAEVQCNIENYQNFIDKPGVHNCNLRGADLSYAILYKANLKGADLRGANLEGANLRFANLEEAYLFRATLRGADLTGANLEGAYFLQTVDLEGANLERAKVTESQAYHLRKKGLSGFVVVE